MKSKTVIKNNFKKVISQLEKQAINNYMLIQLFNEDHVIIANSYNIIELSTPLYNEYIAGARDYLLPAYKLENNIIYSYDTKQKKLVETEINKDQFDSYIIKAYEKSPPAVDSCTIYQQNKNEYPQRFIVNNSGSVAAVNNDIFTSIFDAIAAASKHDNYIFSSGANDPVIIENSFFTALILPIRQGFNSNYHDTIKALSNIYTKNIQILKAV